MVNNSNSAAAACWLRERLGYRIHWECQTNRKEERQSSARFISQPVLLTHSIISSDNGVITFIYTFKPPCMAAYASTPQPHYVLYMQPKIRMPYISPHALYSPISSNWMACTPIREANSQHFCAFILWAQGQLLVLTMQICNIDSINKIGRLACHLLHKACSVTSDSILVE